MPETRIYVEQTNLSTKTTQSKLDLENGIRSQLAAKQVYVTENPNQANIIVTALRSQRRLCRALAVDVSFFTDASPQRSYVPVEFLVKSLEEGRLLPLQEWSFYPSSGIPDAPVETTTASPTVSKTSPLSATDALIPSIPSPRATGRRPSARRTNFPASPLLSIEDLQARWQPHKLACFLWCPLVCVNQELVEELHLMKLGRLIRDGDGIRALAYSHAIAAIKSFPWPITKKTDLSKIPNLGGGTIQARIEEFLHSGQIQLARTYTRDPKFIEMQRIAKIPGYGPVKAAEAVHRGQRFEDFSDCEKRFVDQFDIKIPRREVDEIGELVAEYLEQIQPGCEYTILGGYRRGKPQSNDIDILITHRQAGTERGLLEKLIAVLENDGIMVERLITALPVSRADPNQRMMHSSRFDRLDKTFCVFMPPKRGCLQQIHRRVDLLVAPWYYYYTAVRSIVAIENEPSVEIILGPQIVGWTGSTQFERDLRRQANYKSYKFDSSGLTHKVTSEDTHVQSEEHLFRILDIPYIPPEYRNADA